MDLMNSKVKRASELIKKLTPNERKQSLKELKIIVAELEDTCPHEIMSRSYDSVTCIICEKDFDWWCEESPDSVCHYYTSNHDGKICVQLIDKTYFEFGMKFYKDPEYQTEDVCLFCGQPKERL